MKKRNDPKLLLQIRDHLESPRKNPDLGKKLKGKFEKIYSIRIEEFHFRILYMKEKEFIIIILAMVEEIFMIT